MEKDAAIAKQLYNEQFEKYSQKQNKYKVVQDLRKKIYKILGNIEKKEILFAGCGDGFECLPAARKKANITGIDISEKAIELAQKNCPKGKFYVMDFEKTEFEPKSFDIVVAIFSVMYKKDLKKVLKEFKRILKNNGFILIVVPHPIRKMIKFNKMNYFVRRKKFETWRGIKRFNYYRLTADYVNSAIEAKLKIQKLIEPKPARATAKTPKKELQHPHFLILKLIKS